MGSHENGLDPRPAGRIGSVNFVVVNSPSSIISDKLSGNVAGLLVKFPEVLALVEAWSGMSERERNAVLKAVHGQS